MNADDPKIEWPDGYLERREAETPDKGWLEIKVRLPTGHYRLCFYDVARLKQALEDELSEGLISFTEPGLIIVPKVTTEVVRRAVAERYCAGFFRHLVPLPESK